MKGSLKHKSEVQNNEDYGYEKETEEITLNPNSQDYGMLGLPKSSELRQGMQVSLLRRLRYMLMWADAGSFLAAFFGGHLAFSLIRQESLFSPWWLSLHLSIAAIGLVLFFNLGHYNRRKPFWDEMREISKVVSLLMIFEAAALFLSKSHFPRVWFGSTCVLVFVLVPLIRMTVKRLLLYLGKWQLPTIIFGAGTNAIEAAAALESEPLMGFDIKKFVSLSEEGSEEGSLEVNGKKVPVAPLRENSIETLLTLGEPNFVIALESGGIRRQQDLIENLHQYTRNLYIVPALRGLPLYGAEFNHFFRHEVLLLRVRNNLARPVPRFVKRAFDIVGSFFLLMVLSPFFAFLAWRIRRDGGPAFFGHERVGQNGQPFICFKFRTMVIDAEKRLQELLDSDPEARKEWDTDFKLKNDPRVTRVGSFLRETSLDELPQLWNVLKGEMSLVGPRPVIEEELERYGKNVDYYLEVKPGMTGLWQVSGRNDTDYQDRVYLDAWYAKNWSVWYDVAILFKTVNVVLGRDGAY